METSAIEEYTKELSKSLDCYLIFNSDCHLNEYISDKDRRVLALSGFQGSNGTIIYGKDPCLITDPRYYIAAAQQSKFPLYKQPPQDYILMKNYKTLSFDTRTISSKKFKKLKEVFDEYSISFIETEFKYKIESRLAPEQSETLIDLEKHYLKEFINNDDLEFKAYLMKTLDLSTEEYDKCLNQNLTGSNFQDKINVIREFIADAILVVSEMDTIAWILNLRGSDIPYNPVFYSYMIIDRDEIALFTDKSIDRDGVTVYSYDCFEGFIKNMPNDKRTQVLISGDCNQYIYSILENRFQVKLTDKIRSLQACKNNVELIGMALAYFYDGIALSELFYFIQSKENLTESDISIKLDSLKRAFGGYAGPSFETISSTGTNCAIVHHRASDRVVDKSQVYLIDSGSHYLFGTTDTTRTLIFGKKAETENILFEKLRHDYTLVLKGHLNAMMNVYDSSATYKDIDLISRQFLVKEEKDFAHATGHGVGHFLCVHENPPVIHPKGDMNPIAINQVFSIEPGFYKEDEYGIRIENLVISRPDLACNGSVKLVNITLVPYQNKIMDIFMMDENEKKYYNSCNKTCIDLLRKYLTPKAYEFLLESSNQIE